MPDPYTLLPAELSPTGEAETGETVYAPLREQAFTARMLQTLRASPLALYSWGRGNLPRRLVDVFAGELALLSRSAGDVIRRSIEESTYRAWQHPELFPPRGSVTLARGELLLSTPFVGQQAETFPAGSLFGSADGRTVRSVETLTVPAGTRSATLSVVSEIPGEGGNFGAGEITRFLSGRGNWAVSNPLPVAGGRDTETDAQMRVRFQDFVESRATASRLSVFSAAMNTFIPDPLDPAAQQRPDDAALILPWTLPGESGEMSLGYVVVDGGGGQVSPELLAAAQAKIGRIQAAGDTFTAIAVSPWVASLRLRVVTSRAAPFAAVRAALDGAWQRVARRCLIEDGRGRGRLALFEVQAALDAAHPDLISVQILSHGADLQPPIGARLLPGPLEAELIAGGLT